MSIKNKGRLIYAASLNSADMLYACGFKAPDNFIYFEVGDLKAIVASPLEYNRACNEVKSGIEVFSTDDFKGKKVTLKLLELSKKQSIQCWQVPKDFPLYIADFLRDKNIKIECVEEEFFATRANKSNNEISLITEGLRVAECAMSRVVDILKESTIDNEGFLRFEQKVLTSEKLRIEIEIESIKNGAIAIETITSSGLQTSEPHNIGNGAICANQPIVVDIFPRMSGSGYWGDLTRTYVKGKPSDELQRAYDAVKLARDNAKCAVKAGVKASDIHKIAFDTLKEAGFPTGVSQKKHYGFIHGVGHGVGLEIHEGPRVSPLNQDTLKAGNVITIEPGLYYPEWGGIRLEDMVVVEESGCKELNKIDTFFIID